MSDIVGDVTNNYQLSLRGSVPKWFYSPSLSGRLPCDRIFTVKLFEDLNIPVLNHFSKFRWLRRGRTSYQQIQPARIGDDWLKVLNPLECRSLSTLKEISKLRNLQGMNPQDSE
ncbi:hypothetical protein AVEN_246377-1 [Araneus ventricosus]|uniref:Uncharacterized protein n=1 Tax=Araneus ventricosus TaxID=182803 RepID=A0A4Y2Q5K8_ARAVE|nr:hypothetical protein AVEN_246377-1 [Araneus ventricosus]